VIISLGFFQQVAQDNIDDGSLERLEIWSQNWSVVREHWLLGTGPAGYAIYYMTYFPTDARSTHNNYLDIVAQFGVVGMATWLWLALASVWEGWRLVRRAPPGFLRSLAIIATGGWIGAMGSMVFGDWVLPFAYNQGIAGFKYTVYSWLFLGALISIRHLLDAPPAHMSDPAIG
jgi:O-antigen ligase